jgi:curved DNA-binding protein CbpA
MGDMDYYALLRVEPKAETTAIRSAYYALARVHHPDHSGGSNATMASLNEAWAVLGDVSTRATYDGDHGFSMKGPEPGSSAAPPQPAPPQPVKSSPDVLDFGRYAGWSLRDLARRDPDYLLWLERTSVGRRYRAAIDALLRQIPTPPARASRSGSSRGR